MKTYTVYGIAVIFFKYNIVICNYYNHPNNQRCHPAPDSPLNSLPRTTIFTMQNKENQHQSINIFAPKSGKTSVDLNTFRFLSISHQQLSSYQNCREVAV